MVREKRALVKQLRLDVAQLTDVGRKRDHNEDNMAYHIPPEEDVMEHKGALFIVADGMGGHAAGEVASEIAVDTISDVYYQDNDDDVPASLVHAIKCANASIHQRAAENMLRSGMGTTCVTAVLCGDMAYIANVGDSRAYLVRGDVVKQVSQDHSWVAEQVRAGLLTEDQARTHAQRNVITRCLGTQAEVEIDIFTERLEKGDFLVLCTDGLSGLISDEDLRRIVSQFVPQESVYHLVERANENGGPDNITAIVVQVQEVGAESIGRQPAHIGGRESSEDARVSGGLSTIPLTLGTPPTLHRGATEPGDLTINRGSTRSTSGPLIPSIPANVDVDPISANSDTVPQHRVELPKRRSSRLVHTTVALLVLLFMGLIGAGAYYVYYVLGVQSLPPIRTQIIKAQSEVASDPTLALRDLASAQNKLQGVPDTPINHTQRSQLSHLLTTTAQAAIQSYNTQTSITPLCSTVASTAPINNGSTGTQVQRLAVVQPTTGAALRYALGQDGKLYQLNGQNSLDNPINIASTVQVLDAVGDGARLVILVKASKNESYFLDVAVPGQAGQLLVQDSDNIGSVNGAVPVLVAAQDNEIYVLLASSSATSTQAQLINFTIGSNNTLNPNPTQTAFTLPGHIVSMAAFPNRVLFLLLADGSVVSLQGGVTTAVLLAKPPEPPLAVSRADFTDTTPIPTVPLPIASTGPVPLQVVGGPELSVDSLASAVVGTVPHLYLVDVAHTRILDLSGTPTPVSGTAGNGGKSLLFQTVQQYASASLLAHMRGISVDAAGMVVYVLTQTGSTTMNLLSIKINPLASGSCV